MKSILMSINPKWVAKILNGEKTIEIRKKFPKDYVGWVYIYCTKKYDKCLWYKKDSQRYVLNYGKPTNDYLNGKVVARFWCDKVEELTFLEGLYSPLDRGYCTDTLDNAQVEMKSCVPQENIIDYLYSRGKGYAIHITKLEIFDKPKEISEFKRCQLLWCCEPHDCEKCRHALPLTRAPQSWQFIEI